MENWRILNGKYDFKSQELLEVITFSNKAILYIRLLLKKQKQKRSVKLILLDIINIIIAVFYISKIISGLIYIVLYTFIKLAFWLVKIKFYYLWEVTMF